MRDIPANVASMVKMMSKRPKRGRGRPRRELLTERQMLRLTPSLAAEVEIHRQEMGAKVDEPVDWAMAARDLIRRGLDQKKHEQAPPL